MLKGYYLNFKIKGRIHRFVFTTHALEQMEERYVNEQEVIFLFEGLKGEEVIIEGCIRDSKEIILSDPKLGFSMVLDFKDALKESEGKAIKVVTVIDKSEVFCYRGTELITL